MSYSDVRWNCELMVSLHGIYDSGSSGSESSSASSGGIFDMCFLS